MDCMMFPYRLRTFRWHGDHCPFEAVKWVVLRGLDRATAAVIIATNLKGYVF